MEEILNRKEMEEYHKPNIWIWVVMVVIMSMFIIFMTLTEPVEYNIDCSINGVSVGINESMNFTGFILNNSEIKCKVDGKAPMIALLGLK